MADVYAIMERRSTAEFVLTFLLAIFAGGALAPHLTSVASNEAASNTGRPASGAEGRPLVSERADPLVDVLADHFGITLDEHSDNIDAKFETVRSFANRDYDPDDPKSVRFLIATLPDPIDSYSDWQFDPAMDAIQEAAGASGYVLDRFLFPDVERTRSFAKPGGDPAKLPRTDGLQHTQQPGVVLFRMDLPDRLERRKKRLLVVFVVPETPTAGIHAPAFDAAVRTIERWRTPSHSDPVLVLGPYFSGTSPSMARELRMLPLADSVRVISGSATADDNRRIFASEHIDFHATVPPDSAFDCAMTSFLQTQFGRFSIADLQRYAKLQESNTAYGNFRVPPPDEPQETPDAGSSAASRRSGCFGMPPTVTLRFPLHISRLRSEQQPRSDTSASTTIGVPPKFRPLQLGDNGLPTDQIPVFTAPTSGSYAEMSLVNLLSAIGRERIGVVNIMATDARDKLYLAREIARAHPNVLMYTSENDLLYAHPDYYSATNGMLIASAYSLSAQNRPWSRHEWGVDERRQFPTSSAQGVYNAALALLNYSAAGDFQGLDSRGQLIGYAADDSCRMRCRPPIWISVIGRDSPWSVFEQSIGDNDLAKAYVFPANPLPVSRPINPVVPPARVPVPVGALALGGLLTFLVAAHLANGVQVVRRIKQPRSAERCAYLALSSFALALGWSVVCAIALGVMKTNEAHWTSASVLAAVVVCVGLLAGLCVLIVLALWRGRAAWLRNLAWWIAAATLTTAALELVRYGIGQVDRLSLLLDRAAHLSNGVSPVTPVLALIGCVYLWSVVELWRSGWPGAPSDEEIEYLGEVLSSGDAPDATDVLARARLADFDRSLVDVRGRPMSGPVVTSVALVIGLAIFFALNLAQPPLRSIDGDAFGHAATWLVALVQTAVLLALLQFVRAWGALSMVLERLSARYGADAYASIPAAALPNGVMPRLPRSSAIEHIINHWWHVRSDVRLPDQREYEADINDAARTPLAYCASWSLVLKGAEEAMRKLSEIPVRSALTMPQLVPLGTSVVPTGTAVPVDSYVVSELRTPDDERAAARRKGLEAFALLPVVFIMRTATARMWQNVAFVAGTIALLIVAAASYRFQVRQWLDAFIWIDLTATVAAIWYVFVNMEQNEIIRQVRSTPGRFTWNPELLAKLVVYGFVPLLTLFAVQFPNAVQALLSLLEPVQKALP
jgi:hypothetical protein